ncbi:unnamed protein product [Prorocentrum cordatum]|uniref:Uncharacterized protein n=1 Tax=Prorocentrum cordatum TaxID=2364126 RepID=A0ABN9PRF6_9DINO|nr:unnamed protein product [Polarella glacialis]
MCCLGTWRGMVDTPRDDARPRHPSGAGPACGGPRTGGSRCRLRGLRQRSARAPPAGAAGRAGGGRGGGGRAPDGRRAGAGGAGGVGRPPAARGPPGGVRAGDGRPGHPGLGAQPRERAHAEGNARCSAGSDAIENRYDWVHSACQAWFFGSGAASGMQAVLAKEARARQFQHGLPAGAPGGGCEGPGPELPDSWARPLRLLDVGSNNNFLGRHGERFGCLFDVVAMDISMILGTCVSPMGVCPAQIHQ